MNLQNIANEYFLCVRVCVFHETTLLYHQNACVLRGKISVLTIEKGLHHAETPTAFSSEKHKVKFHNTFKNVFDNFRVSPCTI